MQIRTNLSKAVTRYNEEIIWKGRGCGLCLIFCPARTGRIRSPASPFPGNPNIMGFAAT